MTINEFIQEREGTVLGEFASVLYGMLCKGFLNDFSFESCIADFTGARAHLVFEGAELNYVTITVVDEVLHETFTFRFKMENISDDGPSRYRELN